MKRYSIKTQPAGKARMEPDERGDWARYDDIISFTEFAQKHFSEDEHIELLMKDGLYAKTFNDLLDQLTEVVVNSEYRNVLREIIRKREEYNAEV